jgi:hypothetical protein
VRSVWAARAQRVRSAGCTDERASTIETSTCDALLFLVMIVDFTFLSFFVPVGMNSYQTRPEW